MQNTFKIGDKVRQKDEAVVKASDGSCLYKSQEIAGKVLTVTDVEVDGYLHFDRIKEDIPHRVYCWERFELVESNEVTIPKKQKNHAWAVVDKSTGKVKWIRQTRSVARQLTKFWNETTQLTYQVKKIEFNFV